MPDWKCVNFDAGSILKAEYASGDPSEDWPKEDPAEEAARHERMRKAFAALEIVYESGLCGQYSKLV